MVESRSASLVLENRHTGERLALRRVKHGDEVWLEIKGSLPPHSEGPQLHIHFDEHEEGRVRYGTLSAVVDGRRITAGPGEPAVLPRGSAHRFWNDGNDTLEFEGLVSATLLLLCVCLPLSGRYVDGPLITVFKTYFIWDDFDPQQASSWLLLFAFVWPAAIVWLEQGWQERPMFVGMLQVAKLVGAFHSYMLSDISAFFRSASIGMYLAWTALGIFSLCAIIRFCQILYSEIRQSRRLFYD